MDIDSEGYCQVAIKWSGLWVDVKQLCPQTVFEFFELWRPQVPFFTLYRDRHELQTPTCFEVLIILLHWINCVCSDILYAEGTKLITHLGEILYLSKVLVIWVNVIISRDVYSLYYFWNSCILSLIGLMFWSLSWMPSPGMLAKKNQLCSVWVREFRRQTQTDFN